MSQRKPKEIKSRENTGSNEEGTACFALEEPSDAASIINALKQKAERIRKSQLEQTLKKLPGLSDEEKKSLESMTRDLVHELLHEPIERIEKGAHNDESYKQIVHQLFRLNKDEVDE